MSDVYSYLWLVPVLPLLAAVVIAFFGPRYLRDLSHWPCILALGGSAILSIMTLLAVTGDNPPQTSHDYYTFIHIGPEKRVEGIPVVDVPFSLRADALSAIMLVTVTFI